MVEGGIKMTEVFSFTHWAGDDAEARLRITGGEASFPRDRERYWVGGEHGDTSVTARGCCSGNRSNSGASAQHRGL